MTEDDPQTRIVEAAHRLLQGRLVAFPTETVYGLGADAENPEAIARIYAAKGRPANHPVIVHLPPEGDPEYWAGTVPPLALRLMAAFWPGPLTLILPRAERIPDAVSGGQDSIGLRCPSHPVAQTLLHAFAALKTHGHGGVAAPSANQFGQVSPTRAEHVRSEFPGLDAHDLMVLDGDAAEIGIESTILDLSRLDRGVGPTLLRPGQVDVLQLARVIGDMPARPDTAAPRVSGSLKAHYAPRTPLTVASAEAIHRLAHPLEDGHPAAEGDGDLSGFSDPERRVAIVILGSPPGPAPAGVEWVAAPEDPAGYAHGLYATLRALDQGDFARIVLQRPPQESAWQGVNDRINRAAAAFEA